MSLLDVGAYTSCGGNKAGMIAATVRIPTAVIADNVSICVSVVAVVVVVVWVVVVMLVASTIQIVCLSTEVS